MRVISLGWGCQSFALAAMSALGMLPKVDAAIHADTTWERNETYEFAQRWTPWLEERDVPVVTVSDVKAAKQITDNETGQTHAPVFTVGCDGGVAFGQLRRSCTDRWKITPIRRWLRSTRNGEEPVEQWIGITLDEVGRMAVSDVRYIALRYPFLEMLDRPWSRGMVIRWLLDNGLEVPVKSACIFCPYHNRGLWREIRLANNGDWATAVVVDRAIRNKRPGYFCYLTPERKPLENCDFSNAEDHGQLNLWNTEECSGMCFL